MVFTIYAINFFRDVLHSHIMGEYFEDQSLSFLNLRSLNVDTTVMLRITRL